MISVRLDSLREGQYTITPMCVKFTQACTCGNKTPQGQTASSLSGLSDSVLRAAHALPVQRYITSQHLHPGRFGEVQVNLFTRAMSALWYLWFSGAGLDSLLSQNSQLAL